MPATLHAALGWATEQLADCSESARLDAELLLAFVLGKPRSFLFSWPETTLSKQQWSDFQQLVSKRQLPTPVAYLLGEREFYSLDFGVDNRVLVPRPETELLVEQALAICRKNDPRRIIDLGTGSGIIAVTVKKYFPEAEMWAADIDPGCLAVARANALRHEVDIHFLQSSWYEQLPADCRFDLILSNPPYIAADHPFLNRGDLPGEPQIALSPGQSGLESLKIIIGQANQYLLPGGILMLEHGYDQQRPVFDMFSSHGFINIQCLDDFNGHPRVSLGHWKQ